MAGKSDLGLSYLDDASRNYTVEASSKGNELFGDVFIEDIISIEETVILSILIIDLDFTAVLNKVFNDLLTEGLKLDIKI